MTARSGQSPYGPDSGHLGGRYALRLRAPWIELLHYADGRYLFLSCYFALCVVPVSKQ